MGLELDPGFYKKNMLNMSNENFFGASYPGAGLVGPGTASSNSGVAGIYSPNPYIINNPNSNHPNGGLFQNQQQANLSK